MAEQRKLRVGVVGAGVAGLAAAIGLSRAGHDVEIFERSMFKNELGAAILLNPNASVVLKHWGIDYEAVGATDLKQTRALKSDTLETVYRHTLDDVLEKYGNKIYSFHRVDLHNGLRKLAEEVHHVPISLGSPVEGIDCQAGVLQLEHGRTVDKDLIVVADGIGSKLFEAVNGRDMPVIQTGLSMFRNLVPMDRLMADEKARPFFENQDVGFTTSPHTATGFMIAYPCRNGTLMNVGVFHRTMPHLESDDWSMPATKDDAIAAVKDYHPAWQALAHNADTITAHRVAYRSTVEKMVNGKACIIGDAAHAMLPLYSQGAAMGLEDGAALEVLMADLKPGDEVEKRLQLFEQLRLPRCAITQSISNGRGKLFGAAHEEDLMKRIGCNLPPPEKHWASQPWREFFWRYNVFEEAEKALRYKDERDGVPDGVLQYFSSD